MMNKQPYAQPLGMYLQNDDKAFDNTKEEETEDGIKKDRCRFCGSYVNSDMKFCIECGAKIELEK